MKTQISLGIRAESSLWVWWVADDPMFLHADRESELLLVIRPNDNDNHSPGPVIMEVSP